MINDENYFDSQKLNYIIHKNLRNQRDWQGFNFSQIVRLRHFSQIFKNIYPDLTSNKNYLKNLTNFKQKFCKVNKFIQNSSIVCSHFQLHNILKAISQNDILYMSKSKIISYNIIKGQKKNIFDSEKKIYAFDYLKSKNLLSGVLEDNSIFLYDCKNKKKINTDNIFKIDNIIGRANFIDFDNKINLLISGNAFYASLIDINKLPLFEKKIITKGNINNQDYNKKNKLIGFALENKKIEIFDLKQKKSVIDFESDKGYNLAVKFIEEKKIVSSGTENILKFWDLRNFKQPYKKVDNLVISGHMEYVQKKNLLISLNVYGSIDFVKIKNEDVEIDSFNYFGLSAGLSVSPGGGKCFATINDIFGHGKDGIFEFDLL